LSSTVVKTREAEIQELRELKEKISKTVEMISVINEALMFLDTDLRALRSEFDELSDRVTSELF
jgi:predicted nuclease with TOPRIM domain